MIDPGYANSWKYPLVYLTSLLGIPGLYKYKISIYFTSAVFNYTLLNPLGQWTADCLMMPFLRGRSRPPPCLHHQDRSSNVMRHPLSHEHPVSIHRKDPISRYRVPFCLWLPCFWVLTLAHTRPLATWIPNCCSSVTPPFPIGSPTRGLVLGSHLSLQTPVFTRISGWKVALWCQFSDGFKTSWLRGLSIFFLLGWNWCSSQLPTS